MQVRLAIGDFSRMTHLSVKALRHYHDVGVLEPAQVDQWTGYRFYDATQVPVAQVIRRFRDMGMPLEEVKAAPGRAGMLDVPAAELVVALHEGPFAELDRTYGALGTYVAQRELGVEGPIREYYLVGPADTDDESRHRTEVGWPVFHTNRQRAPYLPGRSLI